MFDKVLIANRGEIAVRITRACSEAGLAAVAVYSDADRLSLHVRRANEAYRIGSSGAPDAYYDTAAMIAIARASGAGAVHPGYGFLAGDAAFAQAVSGAGLVWIGPSPAALSTLRDRQSALRQIAAAGVPIAADDEGAALDDIPGCARRIEVQVLCDARGNCIHLGERECTLWQRRQELVEEAPSAVLAPALRDEAGRLAVTAARAIGYDSAGTAEFLLDDLGCLYFLRFNPCLSVEHPLPELVTGIDIAREQMLIADGQQLRWRQDDVQVRGHAIQCRINATDPLESFAPQSGRINSLEQPAGPGVRVESGVCAGSEVQTCYDPLLAKLAVWGDDREGAVRRMRRALDEFQVMGVATDIPLHRQALADRHYVAGHFDAGPLEGGGIARRARDSRQLTKVAAIAAAVTEHRRRAQPVRPAATPDEQLARARAWRRASRPADL